MNPEGDRPLEPRRRPLSGWYSLLPDVGVALLVAGCFLLLYSAFPGIHPLYTAGLLILSALILLPVRNWFRRQIQEAPENVSRLTSSEWPSGLREGGLPARSPVDL